MNAEVLDFPEIIESAPAPVAAAKTTAIAAGIANVQGEVAKFDQIAAGLLAIEQAHPKNVIVAAIDTPAGMKAAETAWRAYRNPRLEVERARKAAKAPVIELGKAIDTFAGGLETRLREGETHYKAQIDAEEARREVIRAEAARVEAERVATLQTRLGHLTNYPDKAHGAASIKIAQGVAFLQALAIGDDWQEFKPQAEEAKAQAIAKLKVMQEAAERAEAEAAERERQRIENERVAAENARIAAELAAQRAEIERQAAELRAQQEAAARLAAEQEAREQEQARQTAAALERAQQAGREEAQRLTDESAKHARAVEAIAPVAAAILALQPEPEPEPAPQTAAEPATLSLGEICARLGLGFSVTAAFLADRLHIQPAALSPRKTGLYTESQFQTICRQMQSHLSAMAELYAA